MLNDWDCESRDNLRACGSDGTTDACSSGGATKGNSCRMRRVSSISLLQSAMALVTCRGKPSRSVYVSTNVGILGTVGHCEEFDPALVHRAKMEEKDFNRQDGSL